MEPLAHSVLHCPVPQIGIHRAFLLPTPASAHGSHFPFFRFDSVRFSAFTSFQSLFLSGHLIRLKEASLHLYVPLLVVWFCLVLTGSHVAEAGFKLAV